MCVVKFDGRAKSNVFLLLLKRYLQYYNRLLGTPGSGMGRLFSCRFQMVIDALFVVIGCARKHHRKSTVPPDFELDVPFSVEIVQFTVGTVLLRFAQLVRFAQDIGGSW